ncbi:MAG TPA: bifunctional cytidylyltransferase/SDR family oxidoreductase [Candidatus Limnocylindria bacterium]|nr:bifunctional cytidylyltransferase/SDR family oxidoreductase [Candidatus Limnocylindria bacterium]
MRTHAIVLAGGGGSRFGADVPKQFLRLAGEPILLRTLRTIAVAGVDQIVVVVHPEWLGEAEALVRRARLEQRARVVAGGETRNQSTRAGLAELVAAADDDIVLVHDAVRPLLPPEVVARTIEPIAAGAADATDTVIPSADTLVVVDGERVVEIPERSRFRRGQTPQAFRLGVLRAAYDAATAAGQLDATDDLTLVLRHLPGARVVAVAGDEFNLKITTQLDFVLADRMIQMRTLALEPAAPEAAGRALAGARMLVVGGTHGIGQAIAAGAESAGARVEVDGRSRGLDVRDYGLLDRRVEEAAGRLGGLDHVVVTAGVLRIGSLAGCTPAEIAEVVDVNLTGSLNVAHAVHRHLRRGGGSLTLFASSSFTRGRSGYVAYSASKAAVVNLAQGLADEWYDEGIRVNAVSPERTDTEMRRRAFPDEATDELLAADAVAAATLRLIESDLTGQVLDVRRHESRRADVP